MDVVPVAAFGERLAVLIVTVHGDEVGGHAQMRHVLCDVLADSACGQAHDPRVGITVDHGAVRAPADVHVHAADDYDVTAVRIVVRRHIRHGYFPPVLFNASTSTH